MNKEKAKRVCLRHIYKEKILQIKQLPYFKKSVPSAHIQSKKQFKTKTNLQISNNIMK